MTEPGCYAEMSRLLRNLDRPYLLRDHPLLANRPSVHPRQLVENALEQLPPRFRTILTRCDLAGERHTAVALHLGISERHFYRERRRAIAALAEVLEAAPQRAPALHAVEADPDTACLATATAFANMGRIGDAIAVLDRALVQVHTPDASCAIAIRLAELCNDVNDLARAKSYVSVAEQKAATKLSRLEAQIVGAELLLRMGHAARAKHHIASVTQTLKTLSRTQTARTMRALANAHLVLVEISDDLEAFGAGLEAAIESVALARRYQLEPALRMRAQLTLTQMRMLTPTPMAALLDEVASNYTFAQVHGLPRDCADTAGLFSVLYSYSGQHERAIAFGQTALEIDRAVGMSDRDHRYYLALAFLRQGNTEAARATLSELLPTHADIYSFEHTIPQLIEAEALHIERRDHDALAIARSAVYAMRRNGSERGLGSALRVQAEIQSALGEKHSALRSIDQALSLLGKNGPPFPLAQAYTCSAKLTGNRRHKRVAREMMELFR
jgi:tetratricopeptide (TPR) repeat protein